MNKIKLARMERGIRQRELAKQTRLGQSLISKLENDKLFPGPEIAERIGKALHVPADWILEK